MNIQDLPAQSTYTLVEPISSATANPTVVIEWEEGTPGPYKQIDNTPANDVLLTEMPLTITANSITGSEEFWLTGGVEVSGKTRQVRYTATQRSLLNTTKAVPTTEYDRNRKAHVKGAFCTVDETWLVKQLKDTFASTTSEETVTAGEALDASGGALSVSLHTDGKYYKYHATNYPNLQGVLEAPNNIAADATFTLKNLKGTSTNYSGLTPNTLYYAENTGAITTTSSGTTAFLGKARTDEILDHAVDPGVQSSTNAEMITGTDTTPKLQTAAQIKLGVDTHSTTPGASLVALEDLNDSFVQPYGFSTFDLATGILIFGYTTAGQQEQAIKIFGNGTAFNTLSLGLRKQGSPTDNVTIRIETDSSGVPSGTLADVNSSGTVAGTGLTTGLTDTSVSLGGSVTLTDETPYWVVIGRSGANHGSSFYYASIIASKYSSMVLSDSGGSFAWSSLNGYLPYLSCTGVKTSGWIENAVDFGAFSTPTQATNSTPLFFVSSATAGDTVTGATYGNVTGLSGIIPALVYTLNGQTFEVKTDNDQPNFLVGTSSTTAFFNQGLTITT